MGTGAQLLDVARRERKEFGLAGFIRITDAAPRWRIGVLRG
jgi:hypothetical protein